MKMGILIKVGLNKAKHDYNCAKERKKKKNNNIKS